MANSFSKLYGSPVRPRYLRREKPMQAGTVTDKFASELRLSTRAEPRHADIPNSGLGAARPVRLLQPSCLFFGQDCLPQFELTHG
jgi:hypothetical protein